MWYTYKLLNEPKTTETMASLHSHLMFICVLYRPPNSDDPIYTSLSENMDQLLSFHPNSLFLICGDFNCHHASWLGVGTSLTCHGTSAKAFCDSLGLTQSVNFPPRISTNGSISSGSDFDKFPWQYLLLFLNRHTKDTIMSMIRWYEQLLQTKLHKNRW